MSRRIVLVTLCLLILILLNGPVSAVQSKSSDDDADPSAEGTEEWSYQARVRVGIPGQTGEATVVVLKDLILYRFETRKGSMSMIALGNRRAFRGPAASPEMSRALGLSLPDMAGLLAKNYRALVSRVVFEGRRAIRTEYLPYPHAAGLTRIIITDVHTGARLLQEDRSGEGKTLISRRLTRFKEIPFDSQQYKELKAYVQRHGHPVPPFLTAREASKRLGVRLRMPANIPSGYKLLGFRLSWRHPGTAHAMFSDGIGLISLYERKIPWWARRNRIPSPGRTVEWEAHGIHYLLTGDASPRELYLMARSIDAAHP